MMNQTLADTSLIQCTIYFRYYLNQALKVSGLGDQFLDNLQVWRDQMALGLTTWAEMPEPSRSDCHAWGPVRISSSTGSCWVSIAMPRI